MTQRKPPPSGNNKYQFREIPLDGSRFYPTDEPRKIRTAATSFGHLAGRKMRTQIAPERGKQGIRVWRVS